MKRVLCYLDQNENDLFIGVVVYFCLYYFCKEPRMDIVRVKDCLCFKCGKPIVELFKLRTATTALKRADAKFKFDKKVVALDYNSTKIYRHKRRCVK